LLARAFGAKSAIDYKTGAVGSDPDARLVGLQTAAAELHYPDPRMRIAVQLWPNGRYKMIELRSFNDRPRWLSALDLYRTFIFKE
jgi:hypothetical protein